MSDTLKILELVCSNLPDNQDLYLIQSVFINRHEPIDSSLLNKLLFHQVSISTFPVFQLIRIMKLTFSMYLFRLKKI